MISLKNQQFKSVYENGKAFGNRLLVMYVLKNDNSVKQLCCIVETKDVKSNSDKREIENKKIECAKKFYKKLREDYKKFQFCRYLSEKQAEKVEHMKLERYRTPVQGTPCRRQAAAGSVKQIVPDDPPRHLSILSGK